MHEAVRKYLDEVCKRISELLAKEGIPIDSIVSRTTAEPGSNVVKYAIYIDITLNSSIASYENLYQSCKSVIEKMLMNKRMDSSNIDFELEKCVDDMIREIDESNRKQFFELAYRKGKLDAGTVLVIDDEGDRRVYRFALSAIYRDSLVVEELEKLNEESFRATVERIARMIADEVRKLYDAIMILLT